MPVFETTLKEFADLDIGFNRHPINNDVMKKRNVEAIKSAIKSLVYTNSFEKPFHPEIGGNVYYLLFENYTPLVEKMIERMIIDVINNYEPRAKIIQVKVKMDDDNTARISIAFMPVNISTPVEFDVLLERTR